MVQDFLRQFPSKQYPDLKKLPDDIEEALYNLNDNKELRESFGEDVINSYIKLKKSEIDDFNKNERFDKEDSVTDWEKINTLDC